MFTRDFELLLLYLGWAEEWSIWVSLSSAGVGSSRSFSLFYGVFLGAVVDGAEDEDSGDTPTFDVHTLLRPFEHIP